MIDIPETHYARSGDVHIGYQVFGEGPDLVLAFPALTHVELAWDDPPYVRFFRRLASFSRVIHFDRRGCGLSDRVAPPTLEEEAPDLLAVLDEVGSERPFLFGAGHGGLFSLFFAATYPNRTSGVVAYDTSARALWAPDYPIGVDPALFERVAHAFERGAMTDRAWAEMLAPSRSRDGTFVRWLGRMARSSASPAAAAEIVRTSFQLDIRHVLPTVSAPVLVVHRTEDPIYPVEQGRYVAQHVPGASFVEVPGEDYLVWCGDADSVVDEVQAFVTGTRPAPEADRVLATVLFTDFVDSTRLVAEHGDKRWREILDRHDELAATEIRRFSGRQVKTTGDGVLATFDGPARAVRCACAIRDAMRSLRIDLRSGLHTGEIEVRGEDVSGIAVHIGQRVQALAGAGEVLVSRTVTDLVAGSGLEFDDRGEHDLRGVPGRWQLFAVRP